MTELFPISFSPVHAPLIITWTLTVPGCEQPDPASSALTR